MLQRNDNPRLNDLPQAIEQLFKSVQNHADEDDRDFLGSIRDDLNRICGAVANQLNTDSCSAFFVDKDAIPDEAQEICMRGASGRLKQTLDQLGTDGKVYGPYKKEQGNPGLTQIAAHTGLPQWANTREEMEALRNPDESGKGGKGDQYAYPGGTLDQIFRNCIIVPIFAPGRVSSPPTEQEIKDILRRTGHYSLGDQELERHVRFLRGHRVVGLLKAENKQPRFGPDVAKLAHDFQRRLEGEPCQWAQRCGVRTGEQCFVRVAIGKFLEENHLDPKEDKSFEPILRELWEQAQGKHSTPRPVELARGHEWNRVCGPLVDVLTKTWDATFSNQDVELLVSVAMLLGRILPWRTIQQASHQHVVLDENEVGALLIKPQDIEGLQSMYRAAEQICGHLRFLFESLKSDLGYEEHGRVLVIRRQGVLPVRNPISDINARTKTYASLLHKAIAKHNERWDKEVGAQNRRHGRALFTRHSLVSRLLLADYYDIRDVCGIRLTCDYLSDVTRVIQAIFCLSKNWQILIRKVENRLKEPDASGYRSVHLDLLVRAKSIVADADIDCLKKQLKDALSGPPNGTDGLNNLIRDNGELWFPCEIQIRTAYEDSWAGKSHELVYKLDRSHAPLPKTLEDFFTIMSNNLFETDRLSDIVQEQIKEFIAPELGEELRLKALLRERLPDSPAENAVQNQPLKVHEWPSGYLNFTIECARELYRRNIRYGGTSQYIHALSVALQLIGRFGLFPDPRSREEQVPDYYPDPVGTFSARFNRPVCLTDPGEVQGQVTLFALALLHDCWMAATDQETGIIKEGQRVAYWTAEVGAVAAVKKLIRAECGPVIERYGDVLELDLLFGSDARDWVENVLGFFRGYWRAELGDIRREDLGGVLPNASNEGSSGTLHFVRTPSWTDMIRQAKDADRLNVCRLMAALLIERLEELPKTPNKERRRDRFKEGYRVYRVLRDDLQGTYGGAAILDECYTTLQSVAAQLGVEIPIHWYE